MVLVNFMLAAASITSAIRATATTPPTATAFANRFPLVLALWALVFVFLRNFHFDHKRTVMLNTTPATATAGAAGAAFAAITSAGTSTSVAAFATA